MTGSPLARAASISDLMYSRATQLSSPQEVRQRLIDSRMGSGRSPQKAQLTSITTTAGRLPNPARAPNPPAANTALSRSVKNRFQIGSLMAVAPVAYPILQPIALVSESFVPGQVPATNGTGTGIGLGRGPVAAEEGVPHLPQFGIERGGEQLVCGGLQILQPQGPAGAGGDADDPRHRGEVDKAPAAK